MERIEFKISICIGKPLEEIFDAVFDPEKLSGYFVQSATPMRVGAVSVWRFPEVAVDVPVTIVSIESNRRITFEWEAMEGGYNTEVEMEFESVGADSARIVIRESGWRKTEEARKNSYLNCMGWAHMASFLKAYLEYGVNLRSGAYTKRDFPESLHDAL